MRKKLAAGIVAGAIILGVPGYTIFHSYQANAEEARVLDNATDAVNSLYASKKYNYLADGVSKNDIQKAQKLVSDVADSKKQKSLAEKASNAAIMLEASNAVKEDIVDGVIVDDLTKSILSVTKESVDKVKPISKDLYKDLSKDLSKAYDQIEQIDKTKKLLKDAKKDWNSYKKIEKEVNKISNQTAKKSLKKQLETLKKRIEDQESISKKAKEKLNEIEKTSQKDSDSKAANDSSQVCYFKCGIK